jgi:hypothetical protein
MAGTPEEWKETLTRIANVILNIVHPEAVCELSRPNTAEQLMVFIREGLIRIGLENAVRRRMLFDLVEAVKKKAGHPAADVPEEGYDRPETDHDELTALVREMNG